LYLNLYPKREAEALLETLTAELAQLRKTVLRQGHAQELFQARVEEAVGQLVRTAERAPASPLPAAPPALSSAQVRVLVELDQAVLQLLHLADGEAPKDPNDPDDVPRSLREGLSLLQIRVRNLQRSLGLEAIPTRRRPFDDRWHEACAVAHRLDLPDGEVVEEILPGYRLGNRIVRPARVVVNRHREEEP
jgi:hypothetical protein